MESKQSEPVLLTRRQVAQLLGVCDHTVQRLTKRNILPALVFNKRRIRYTLEAVKAYIASANVQQPTEKDSQ